MSTAATWSAEHRLFYPKTQVNNFLGVDVKKNMERAIQNGLKVEEALFCTRLSFDAKKRWDFKWDILVFEGDAVTSEAVTDFLIDKFDNFSKRICVEVDGRGEKVVPESVCIEVDAFVQYSDGLYVWYDFQSEKDGNAVDSGITMPMTGEKLIEDYNTAQECFGTDKTVHFRACGFLPQIPPIGGVTQAKVMQAKETQASKGVINLTTPCDLSEELETSSLNSNRNPFRTTTGMFAISLLVGLAAYLMYRDMEQLF